MNIPPKYIATGVVFFIAFFGYNAFLAQRDQKMFDAYYGNLTPKEKFCQQQAGWHPDCNLE